MRDPERDAAHPTEGTIVKGVVEVFITEILSIEELLPSSYEPEKDGAPEEWYREVGLTFLVRQARRAPCLPSLLCI